MENLLMATLTELKTGLVILADSTNCNTVVHKLCYDDSGTMKDLLYKKATLQTFKIEADESLIEV